MLLRYFPHTQSPTQRQVPPNCGLPHCPGPIHRASSPNHQPRSLSPIIIAVGLGPDKSRLASAFVLFPPKANPSFPRRVRACSRPLALPQASFPSVIMSNSFEKSVKGATKIKVGALPGTSLAIRQLLTRQERPAEDEIH